MSKLGGHGYRTKRKKERNKEIKKERKKERKKEKKKERKKERKKKRNQHWRINTKYPYIGMSNSIMEYHSLGIMTKGWSNYPCQVMYAQRSIILNTTGQKEGSIHHTPGPHPNMEITIRF